MQQKAHTKKLHTVSPQESSTRAVIEHTHKNFFIDYPDIRVWIGKKSTNLLKLLDKFDSNCSLYRLGIGSTYHGIFHQDYIKYVVFQLGSANTANYMAGASDFSDPPIFAKNASGDDELM